MGERYIYAVTTSPRNRGNSMTLWEHAVAGARDRGARVVEDDLGRDPVNPCMGCNQCGRTGQCVQQDRMQEVYPHLLQASAVILAAPVFSMHVCAQAKAFIDRCQRLWSIKYVLKRHVIEDETARKARAGLFLSVCGRDAPETFDCVKPTIAYFFHVLEISNWERLELAGVDDLGDILQRPDDLERAGRMGAALASRVMPS